MSKPHIRRELPAPGYLPVWVLYTDRTCKTLVDVSHSMRYMSLLVERYHRQQKAAAVWVLYNKGGESRALIRGRVKHDVNDAL